MKIITGTGTFVECFDDELKKVYDLKCLCGHSLYQHAFYVSWKRPDTESNTVFTSQCTACDVSVKTGFECPQFIWEGHTRTSKRKSKLEETIL